jgi:hypothetical protein
MAIIGASGQVELTDEQKKVLASKTVSGKLRGDANRVFNDIVRTAVEDFKTVWQHPILTPQEAFDSLGEDAVEICRIHAATIAFVNTIKANTLPSGTPLPLTANEDGTVTVG